MSFLQRSKYLLSQHLHDSFILFYFLSLFYNNMQTPSSHQPAHICLAVNPLAVKLKDWLQCLSSFYLFTLTHFHFHHKRGNEGASCSISLLRQGKLAAKSQDTSSRLSRTIVYQIHCDITTLKGDDYLRILWTITVREMALVTTE